MFGELHRIVHIECFGQGFGGFGGTQTGQGVAADQAFAAQPGVETAPARDDECDATRCSTAAVHLRHPASHVVGLHLFKRHTGFLRQGLQAFQVVGVQGHGALGQAFFELRMRQIAFNQSGLVGHAWVGQRRRVRAALANSPMRLSKSVPIDG